MRSIFLFFKRHRFIGAFLLLLLILVLVLPLTVLLIQQKTLGTVQGLGTPSTSPSSTPSAPSPSTPLTSYPANIDFETGGYGMYHHAALTNPTIGGVDINLNWVAVEPQQGKFQFGPLDKEIADWASHGKKYTLIVRYVSEEGTTTGDCSGTQFMPAWEIARIPHFCDRDLGTIIPDYFDPTFQSDVQAFVKAIADHVAQSRYKDQLSYARVGVGLAGEGFFLTYQQAHFDTYKTKLVSWGYSPTAWKIWQEQMMSYYKSVFPYTTVIYPIVQLDTDPTTNMPVQMEVAYWAAAQGIGVGEQGLVPNYPSNYAEIKTILTYIQSNYPNTYIQFQTVSDVSGEDAIQGDIQTAYQLGARSIEWYGKDAVNQSYQSDFQQWQQMVDKKYGTNG